jgi:hypothetical protein
MLYAPLKRYVINVRASYFDETREQVDKLWDVNVRKIAVIYQDDAFGKAVLDGVKLALAKRNSTPVALTVRRTIRALTTSIQQSRKTASLRCGQIGQRSAKQRRWSANIIDRGARDRRTPALTSLVNTYHTKKLH